MCHDRAELPDEDAPIPYELTELGTLEASLYLLEQELEKESN